VSPVLIEKAAGPITELRGASPKQEAVGMLNALVLNHSRVLGLESDPIPV